MGSFPIRAGDLWGGLAAMLLALPSAIAFGVVVYTAIDPSLAGQGALFGMLGAAALGLVASLAGGTPALISAPCAPAAAMLAGLAATLVASGVDPARVPGLLGLTALFAALLQAGFGLIKGGRFIKYVPYPVVSGFLSGVGLIIALGQLPKLLGLPPRTGLWPGLVDPSRWHWPSLVVGGATILVMVGSMRLTSKVPAAILGLLAGVLVYFLLGLAAAPEILVLKDNPMVMGPVAASGSLLEVAARQFQALLEVGIEDLYLIAYPALALAVLLSIDTLKTCVMLDALTHGRHRANRELIGQGIGNLAAFAVGGMPGAGTTGPTLINVNSGGKTRGSGVIEGIFVVLAILALSPVVGWVPLPALAGILLVVAFRMFDVSAFRLFRHADTRLDFVVIAAVTIVAATVGLIVASGVGVGLAILLFTRDQIRSTVLRRHATLTEISSKTHRLEQERDLLHRHGDLGAVYDLQGNLFFGTTDQLFTQLDRDLGQRRWMLFDLRRVQSMDYTAANLLRQMQGRLAEHGGALLLCGMPSSLVGRQDIEGYLIRLGLLGEADSNIRVFETRDEALEWMENQILSTLGWAAGEALRPLDLEEIELMSDLDRDTLAEVRDCVEEISMAAGDKLFRRGDEGDEIFLIRSGVIRVLLPLIQGKRHHLATFTRGDYLGEMAFIDRETRSADAVAKSDCELYALSRAEFDRHVRTDPAFGVRVFERLAHAVSLNLRETNAKLRVIEDR